MFPLLQVNAEARLSNRTILRRLEDLDVELQTMEQEGRVLEEKIRSGTPPSPPPPSPSSISSPPSSSPPPSSYLVTTPKVAPPAGTTHHHFWVVLLVVLLVVVVVVVLHALYHSYSTGWQEMPFFLEYFKDFLNLCDLQ